MLMAHLAATGQQDRIAALSLLVTVLDQHKAGTPGALTDRRAAEAAVARSSKQGYLDGAALAEVFAWLRPRDLVWNYWVNNYLLGKSPPAFDILSWNADTTRMPARLHRDFIDLAQDNKLTQPGRGHAAAARRSTCRRSPSTPTSSPVSPTTCARGRTATRARSCSAGTAASCSRPAGTSRPSSTRPATRRRPSTPATKHPDDAEKWLENADENAGSWWDDYTQWLAAHSGSDRVAPSEPGDERHKPMQDAPGDYVLAT